MALGLSNIFLPTALLIFFIGGVLGMFADRFAYWFHVSPALKWRKHCPKCFTFQAWITFLPILGYVINRGVCSNCKIKLPMAPWITELFSAIMLLSTYVSIFGFNNPKDFKEYVQFFLLCFILLCGAILAISDLVYDELPMHVFVLGLVACFLNAYFTDSGQIIRIIFGILLAAIIMGILVVASDWQWVHGHDLLLGVFVAAFVGFPVFFVTLALTYIFAVGGGIISWGWRRKPWRGVSSFGPYLFLALIVQSMLSVLGILIAG